MIEALDVMAWARKQSYEPGQNVRGTPMGALHCLLVHDLESVRSIAWLGSPREGDRSMLRAAMPAATLHELLDPLALEAGIHDLVVVTDTAVARRIRSERAAARAVVESLGPGGTTLVEARGFAAGRVRAALAAADPSMPTELLRTFPLRGPLRAILPAADRRGLAILDRRQLLRSSLTDRSVSGAMRGPDSRGAEMRSASAVLRATLRAARPTLQIGMRLLAAAERLAGRSGIVARFLVVHGPGAGRIPEYLREPAAEAVGPDTAWSLVAPGDFPSQKVLWLVRHPSHDDATLLVKMTRAPQFSPRLYHAHVVLRGLTTSHPSLMDGLPRPLFAGGAGVLAVTAEENESGHPLGSTLERDEGAQAVETTIDWLTRLAERTRKPASGDAVASALGEIQDRLEVAVTIDRHVATALRDGLSTLGGIPELPVVQQHGDPGVNNILVRNNGGIVVLDWENGEAHGMPLWDLLYFVRSVAVATRGSARTARLEASLVPFTSEGPLNELLADSIHRLTARIDLPGPAIGPLVVHCWVQQALKETTRLTGGRAHESIFLQFLERIVSERTSRAFRRLVEAGSR